MTAPRIEIDLDKIHQNARSLVRRLALRGIAVVGVTKASLGATEIAREMCRAGVVSLGDSRLENIETMRKGGVEASMMLLRSPMLSQVGRVVENVEQSLNTEIVVIRALSRAAQCLGRIHGIVLMVELGDLREGILPRDLKGIAAEVLKLPNLVLKGIGANLACLNGVVPDAQKMTELSALADSIEASLGLTLEVISGGNSANLSWVFGAAEIGRVNQLRLGESILLGRETLDRRAIQGLSTDAFTLVAEVIESKRKPAQPWGEIAQAAFEVKPIAAQHGNTCRAVLALGRQDTDPEGIVAAAGFTILGASSDHLMVDCGQQLLPVGSEMCFQLNYSALVRSMTSPFVAKVMKNPSRDHLEPIGVPAS